MSIRRRFAVLVPLFAALFAGLATTATAGVGITTHERFIKAEGTNYSQTNTIPGQGYDNDTLLLFNLFTPPTANSMAMQASSSTDDVLLSISQVSASFSGVDNEPPSAFATAQSRYYVEFEITGQSVDYTLDGAFAAVSLMLGEDTSGEARSTVLLRDETNGVDLEFIETVYTATGGLESSRSFLETGQLDPGLDYSFLVESYVTGTTASDLGSLTGEARHQVTLTLPEPATVGLLGVGALAGLLRRRRWRK